MKPLPLVVALILACALAACGRRGYPSPPGPPSAITYPQTYPAE